MVKKEVIMKAERPNGGYIFHGGCHGCTNPIQNCPDCRYMLPNWNLPDLNPYSIGLEKEREAMISLARTTKKNT